MINPDLVTIEQINTMRRDLGPEFPRPEGQRLDGALICALTYTSHPNARAQGYVAIDPSGQIIPDTTYSYRRKMFVTR